VLSLPVTVARRVGALLSAHADTEVAVVTSTPITEGWIPQVVPDPWPWVVRCTLRGGSDVLPPSVIVKLRRPDDHPRSGLARLHTERAALEFLTAIGSTVAPRLLAVDDQIGLLVIEDLGTSPALDDLLVARDAAAAEHGLRAFATVLGQLHASTVGLAADYEQLRSRYGPIDPQCEQPDSLDGGLDRAWRDLQAIATERTYLPRPAGVEADVDELFAMLAAPGPYLALSNGDVCPQNCRLTAAGPRLIDFEAAAFRHALLDATALRFPFQACPCWSRLPADVGRHAEAVYRAELARACPDVLDPASYHRGMTAACAAWTIDRLVRLPKLEQVDTPHPMGFSRRGQVLDAIGTTVAAAQQSGSLQHLAGWLDTLATALRRRWPELPASQAIYPAFRPARTG